MLVTAYLSDGRKLSSSRSRRKTALPDRFYSPDPSGVTHYRERVSKLSYVMHLIASYGLNEKAYKSMNRLSLVAYTTSFRNFQGLVRKICSSLLRGNKIRNPCACAKHLHSNPTFGGELPLESGKKKVRIWTWVKKEKFLINRSVNSSDGWA